MRRSALLPVLLWACAAAAARSKPEKILLSDVSSLTLRAGQKTTGRRSSPIPQLTCEGPACPFYTLDALRCTNAGSSYGGREDVEWTCTASLPASFKLGATDVQCEGYDSRDDPYVLRGSCGVTYRLLLTEEGERRYADQIAERSRGWWRSGADGQRSKEGDVGASLFWVLFVAVLAWMAYSACVNARGRGRRARRAAGGRRPGGGGGGGGGWPPSDPPPYDEDPPPYDSRWNKPSASVNFGLGGNRAGSAWRPGFWTGALGGAAAGYAASSARGRGNRNAGEGSSRSGGSSSGGGGGWSGGASHESTGFGGTSRR